MPNSWEVALNARLLLELLSFPAFCLHRNGGPVEIVAGRDEAGCIGRSDGLGAFQFSE